MFLGYLQHPTLTTNLYSLVSYQLRSSYLDDIADGVGERLLTLNDGFLNSAAYKAAGWRTNHALSKRTHSPPIPTAIASEYFQAPRFARHTLEDEADDAGMLTVGGDSTLGPGMAIKRRRRREQMEEDDSSDLSDESDDESDTRPAQQIKFAKMPVRGRAGSSPLQSSNLRQMTTASSPHATGPGLRRGSQSALDTVKERVRRDTVTSSEISSENEFDASGFHRQREQARLAARMAAAKASRSRAKSNDDIVPGLPRHDSLPLPEEEEEESDASDISDAAFAESIDSASILDAVDNPIHGSPTIQVVGTPPRAFTRQSTIRRSHAPQPRVLEALPPPRPMSTIRPISMVQPVSMLSELLGSKKSKSKPTMPFQTFASLSGEGDNRRPMLLRIYVPFSEDPDEPFEVLIRRDVSDDAGGNFRVVTVGDAIGLSLLRYIQEKRQPPLPTEKLNVNWYSLRIVEEGGEIDDDFPPLERKKPLASFTTVNNRAAASNFQQGAATRGGGRNRANSNKAHDEFALVQASASEYEENKKITPEYEPDEEEIDGDGGGDDGKDATPKNTTPQPDLAASRAPYQPRQNPVLTTAYRPGALLDQPQVVTSVPHTRGQQKLLRVNILSSDTAPGQLVTLDVTTDTYLAEVLDLVCKKRQLDKVNHVLKIPNSGAVVMVDRPVASLGAVSELELHRRRFATDGPLTVTGSPSSASPKLPFTEGGQQKRWKKDKFMGVHPLAREALKQDELNNANYKKYTVWRKQPMRIVGMSERIFIIDGEYIHIMAASGAKGVDGGRKATTVHFSNVVGCKVMRKHPTTFKVRHFHVA